MFISFRPNSTQTRYILFGIWWVVFFSRLSLVVRLLMFLFWFWARFRFFELFNIIHGHKRARIWQTWSLTVCVLSCFFSRFFCSVFFGSLYLCCWVFRLSFSARLIPFVRDGFSTFRLYFSVHINFKMPIQFPILLRLSTLSVAVSDSFCERATQSNRLSLSLSCSIFVYMCGYLSSETTFLSSLPHFFLHFVIYLI